MKWIHIAQDRDQVRTFVDMVVNLPTLQKNRNFLCTFAILTTIQEGMSHEVGVCPHTILKSGHRVTFCGIEVTISLRFQGRP